MKRKGEPESPARAGAEGCQRGAAAVHTVMARQAEARGVVLRYVKMCGTVVVCVCQKWAPRLASMAGSRKADGR